jgi:hypothetical protein
VTRRDFLSGASRTTVYGVLASQLALFSTPAIAGEPDPVPIPDAVWKHIQKLTNYSDKELEIFKNQPRTRKIVRRFEKLSAASVIFEVKKAHGCVAGHKPGDYYLFKNGGSMDTRNSSPGLCPFLMPPMTRIMWIVQERVWEGLDPLPLYQAGQCDDVGLDCNGWGRVIIEARLVKPAEIQSLTKRG